MGRSPIQRIGPSRREVAPVRANLSPEAFGAGIAQALQQRASALGAASEQEAISGQAQQNLTNAYDDRQRRAWLAENRVRFIQMENAFAREQIEAAQEAPRGAPNFTNTRQDRARSLGDEFLSSLPDDERVRETFAPMVEDFVQNAANTAFDFELDAQEAQFTNDASVLGLEFSNRVLNPQTPVEALPNIRAAWEEERDAYLANSTLNAEATELLRRQLDETYNRSELARMTQESTQAALAGRPDLFADPTARNANLPQPQSQFDTSGVQSDVLTGLARLENRFQTTFNVRSAHRSAAENAAAGGARHSQHIQGNALDIDVSDWTTAERVEFIRAARQNGFGGIGVYANSIHIDMGRTRHWGSDYTGATTPQWARNAIQEPRIQMPIPGGASNPQYPIAAAGLPAAAVALLQLIGGGESGNRYDVLFSPGELRTFSDFSRHPNNPATIQHGPHAGNVSSAAGRYQIIIGTWEENAAELGITDFSPASQDLVVWHIAQKQYRLDTGRDLLTDLQSGNPSILAGIRASMGHQWEAVANSTDSEFSDTLATATSAAPSYIYDDETYGNIPVLEREEIFAAAQQRAMDLQRRQVAEFDANTELMMDGLQREIAAGNATLQDIENFAADRRLSFEQTEDLREQHRERFETEYLATEFAARVSNPNIAIDPTDEDTEAGLDAIFQVEQGGQRLRAMDEDYVSGRIVPMAQRAGLSDATAQTLLSQAYSTDFEQRDFGFASLAKLQVEAPAAFNREFDQATAEQVALFRNLSGTVDRETLYSMLDFARDPANDAARERRRTLFTTEISDSDDPMFDSRRLVREVFGRGVSADFTQEAQFQAGYLSVAQRIYEMTGSLDRANAVAEEVIQRRYGVVEQNGSRQLMSNPPQNYYPIFNGGYDYVEEQHQEIAPNLNTRYDSDALTRREIEEGLRPSYQVFVRNEFGDDVPLQFEQTDDFRVLREGGVSQRVLNAMSTDFVRFVPEVTQAMIDRRNAELLGTAARPVEQAMAETQAAQEGTIARTPSGDYVPFDPRALPGAQPEDARSRLPRPPIPGGGVFSDYYPNIYNSLSREDRAKVYDALSALTDAETIGTARTAAEATLELMIDLPQFQVGEGLALREKVQTYLVEALRNGN